jgi:2-dehydro-3-deoxyphosphogluconate aldolase/(4S)-4-hydroxy-2-oxoglutarate aldolase
MTPRTPDARAAAVDAVFERAPVMPVLAIERIEDALPLGRALVDGGLPVLEITLRTDCALDAIAMLARELPQAVVGAGTVLAPADLDAVSRAGAAFAIAPGATAALYAAAAQATIPFIPAVATASEIMHGLDHGYRRFKFFPALPAGGVGALKAFAGPFPQVRFCPTGGIDAASAPAFLALPNVGTVGGSWMVPADRVRARDWESIRALAASAAALRKPHEMT